MEHSKPRGLPFGEGHLFHSPAEDVVDEADLALLADLFGDFDPYGPHPPRDEWRFSHLGQPTWLLASEWHQLGCGWAVIVPPNDDSQISYEIHAARAIDRRDQSLERWGKGRTFAHLQRVRAVGPAAMPIIPWATPRPTRRGNPGVLWNEPEIAGCCAWLSDVRGWTNPRIHKALFAADGDVLKGDDDGYDEDGSARKKVRRYIRNGRQALCDQGVWPWMASPLRGPDEGQEGQLCSRWWDDFDVLAHLDLWHQFGYESFGGRLDEIERLDSKPSELPSAWT